MISHTLENFLVILVGVYFFFVSMCILNSHGEDVKMLCNDQGTNCSCPVNPLTARYPDPADPTCVWYYLCHLGFPIRKRCEVRFAFYPEKSACFPRVSLPFNACRQAVDCSQDGYFPDPFDCTKYYLCFYHQAYQYGCKFEHYFDASKGHCIENKPKAETCKPMHNFPEEVKSNKI